MAASEILLPKFDFGEVRRFAYYTSVMKHIVRYKNTFLVISIIGFAVINLPFLYYAFIGRDVYTQAMGNGMALLFMSEAFLLMFFIAFLIAKMKMKKPGWEFFIAMSILGSLAFSIPFQLYLIARKNESKIN